MTKTEVKWIAWIGYWLAMLVVVVVLGWLLIMWAGWVFTVLWPLLGFVIATVSFVVGGYVVGYVGLGLAYGVEQLLGVKL